MKTNRKRPPTYISRRLAVAVFVFDDDALQRGLARPHLSRDLGAEQARSDGLSIASIGRPG